MSDWKSVKKPDASKTFKKISELLFGKNPGDPRIAEALTEILKFSKTCNKYIDETKPWEVEKVEGGGIDELMLVMLDHVYQLGVMIWVYLPDTSDKIMRMLELDPIQPQVGVDIWGRGERGELRFIAAKTDWSISKINKMVDEAKNLFTEKVKQ